MPNPLSATDPIFLDQIKSFFDTTSEVLVLIRYSRAAGSKNFQFLTSFAAFESLLNPLPVSASVTVFKSSDLPHRGIFDDAFLASILTAIADGTEFFLIDLENNNFTSGDTHGELREAMEDFRGRKVAIGPYPPFVLDTPEIITAYVPDKNGAIKIGVY